MDETPIPVDAWRAAHGCPQCSNDVRWSGRGRPPIYCGDRCRRRAYDAAHAARAGLVSREVVLVQTPPAKWELSIDEQIPVIKALRRLVERDEIPLASFRLLAFEVEELAAACTQLARRLLIRRQRDPSVPPLDTHPVALDRSQQSLAQARRALEECFAATGVPARKS